MNHEGPLFLSVQPDILPNKGPLTNHIEETKKSGARMAPMEKINAHGKKDSVGGRGESVDAYSTKATLSI